VITWKYLGATYKFKTDAYIVGVMQEEVKLTRKLYDRYPM
jgi:hypothetical protein